MTKKEFNKDLNSLWEVLKDKDEFYLKTYVLDLVETYLSHGKDSPMGVSQWKEHGKKYGYWDYFCVSKYELLNKLGKAWESVPEWRLGQLIFNLTGQYDCFHIQDKELNKSLDNFIKNN